MLSDLDAIMAEAGIDWIVAQGTPSECADIHYLVGGARLHGTTVLKRRGEPPTVVVGVMERDEARRAGLEHATPNEFGHAELLAEDLTRLELASRLLVSILKAKGVRGRVALSGAGRIAHTFPMLTRVLAACPEIELAEEPDVTALERARSAKSAEEIARIADVGARTEEVVRLVRDMLVGLRAERGVLWRSDGSPLKIGHVKERIRLELARRGLDDGGATIFAAGREAGFPHSRGDEAAEVPTGRTIIFDIFPQERGGGYFFDMTRTLWIGEVPARVHEVYAAVREAFEATCAAAAPGVPGRDLDALACDVLERHGHVTKRSAPRTEVGYMHSLGHGVGLEIHERPSLALREGNRDRLGVGAVFTIEPGLYYPDEEIGVRIEDTLVLEPDGKCRSLNKLPPTPLLGLTP